MERVLVGPPCRTTMPGIERPANAREGETALGDARPHWPATVRVATGRITPQARTGTRHREGTVSPRSGDVLRVTRQASVQFTEPMLFRVIRVHDWQTYDGWAWLDGYELDSAGEAVERRSIFVELDGLQYPTHQ